jgi:predicted dehydrogenase
LPIKTGVIGVGYLGQHHARIYNELDNAELVAVVDTDAQRAERIAALYGTKACSDYRDILGDAQAVSIVTTTSGHFDIAMDCLRAGVDVLVEKPITSTVKEADDLIEEAEKGGRILQVGHLERYNPAVVGIEGLLDGLEFIESERVSPFVGRATDVDVTLDLMIHDIDIIMSLVGGSPIKDIKVVGAKVLTEKIDVAKAWVEFENGVSALIAASRVASETRRFLKIYQRDSFIVLDYRQKKITRHIKTAEGISTESIAVEDKEPLKEELSDFIDCAITRRRPKVSGVEGREALKVAMRISELIKGAGVHG